MVPANRTVINHNICKQKPTLHYITPKIQSSKTLKKKKKTLDIHIKRTNCNKIMQKEGEKARVRVWERRGTPGPESDCVPLLDLETLVLL